GSLGRSIARAGAAKPTTIATTVTNTAICIFRTPSTAQAEPDRQVGSVERPRSLDARYYSKAEMTQSADRVTARPAAKQNDGPLARISLPHRLCSGRVTGVPLPKAHPTAPDQRRRHVAHGSRCPRLYASPVEGSGAKRPVAKRGPITPCEGRCRRCQQATRTRVAL